MKSQEEQWLLKEKYNGEKTEAFFADCKALALGTPLGYLIGQVPFLDCTIHLDEHPLIPRVETEFWTEQAITAIKQSNSLQSELFSEAVQPPRILDLCAGSGCIGVAVAKHVPAAQVDFAELNARLIPTISTNCKANGVAHDRCTTYHSNLFEAIPAGTTYDFILSNPPYIDPAIDRATESVKSHEPHLALYGGEGGIEIIEQLITAAPDHLVPGGQLWIEHEPEQAAAINDIARAHNFAATNHPDQYDVVRYCILVLQ
jgi:HemK-like putative methylase